MLGTQTFQTQLCGTLTPPASTQRHCKTVVFNLDNDTIWKLSGIHCHSFFQT